MRHALYASWMQCMHLACSVCLHEMHSLFLPLKIQYGDRRGASLSRQVITHVQTTFYNNYAAFYTLAPRKFLAKKCAHEWHCLISLRLRGNRKAAGEPKSDHQLWQSSPKPKIDSFFHFFTSFGQAFLSWYLRKVPGISQVINGTEAKSNPKFS